jgi:predicted peptidase
MRRAGTGAAVCGGILAAVLAAQPGLAAQSAASTAGPPQVTETTFEFDGGATVRYAISLPAGYVNAAADPRPLVVALHPGGSYAYYGSEFMRSIVEPGLRAWGAVMVAPDVPDGSWATARSARAVLALVEQVAAQHAIDRSRVLVTGFSMGGRGTWYMAARHPEVFTGAIAMAGSPGRMDVEQLAGTPLYLINSSTDEVVPFEGAEEAYRALAQRNHPIELRVLQGVSHYSMGAYIPALRLAGQWMQERWGAMEQ